MNFVHMHKVYPDNCACFEHMNMFIGASADYTLSS